MLGLEWGTASLRNSLSPRPLPPTNDAFRNSRTSAPRWRVGNHQSEAQTHKVQVRHGSVPAHRTSSTENSPRVVSPALPASARSASPPHSPAPPRARLARVSQRHFETMQTSHHRPTIDQTLEVARSFRSSGLPLPHLPAPRSTAAVQAVRPPVSDVSHHSDDRRKPVGAPQWIARKRPAYHRAGREVGSAAASHLARPASRPVQMSPAHHPPQTSQTRQKAHAPALAVHYQADRQRSVLVPKPPRVWH